MTPATLAGSTLHVVKASLPTAAQIIDIYRYGGQIVYDNTLIFIRGPRYVDNAITMDILKDLIRCTDISMQPDYHDNAVHITFSRSQLLQASFTKLFYLAFNSQSSKSNKIYNPV